MIEITKMKAEDLIEAIELGVKEIGRASKASKEIIAEAKQRETSGNCITGRVNGDLIGVGGVNILWPGVAEIWLLVTPLIDSHIKEGYKAIKKGIHKLIKNNCLWRVETFGRVDFLQCHTLLKHLGFKVEGLARKRTHDKVDCIMYAKVT